MSIATLAGVALYVLDLGVKLIALGVVPRNRRPASGMAWLLVILAVPALGIVLFLLLGGTEVDRKRRRRQEVSSARVLECSEDSTDAEGPVPTEPRYLASVVELNRRLGALPLAPGNTVDLISDYGASIAGMTTVVDEATSFVHVEFYICACDHVTEPFFDALDRAAARGVRVRLLLDHLGSRGIPGYGDLVARLDASAIEWRRMMPIRPLKGEWRRPDLRNHRKILVVDGVVSFTGSQNLIEPGYHKRAHRKAGREWVELVARLEGPLVRSLSVVFATDWHTETGETLIDELVVRPPPVGDVAGQVIPSGPGGVENNLRLFTSLIYAATHRVSLTSPYFVPDESLLYAVTTAAQRGVEVELFVSAVEDHFMVFHAQRSYYEVLLRAGVALYLYPEPYVLHSKHFTIDDDVAVLGSSNMDMRSFGLNYEVSTMFVGSKEVGQLRRVEDSYRALSHRLTLEEWLARPRKAAYLDNVMRLTAALQ